MCQGQPNDWSGSLVNHGKFKDCLRNAGEDDCEVSKYDFQMWEQLK